MQTGAEVFVKYENLQVTNSFKDRGAFIKLQSLTPEERERGVVAMSAGNHAQAVRVSRASARHRRDHCHARDDAIREGRRDRAPLVPKSCWRARPLRNAQA